MSKSLMRHIQSLESDIESLKDLQSQLEAGVAQAETDEELDDILSEIDDIGDRIGLKKQELEGSYEDLKNEMFNNERGIYE
jgi:phage shock protein A